MGEGPYSQPLSLQTLEDGMKDAATTIRVVIDLTMFFSSQWSPSVLPSGGHQFHEHQTDLDSSSGRGTEWNDHLL